MKGLIYLPSAAVFIGALRLDVYLVTEYMELDLMIAACLELFFLL